MFKLSTVFMLLILFFALIISACSSGPELSPLEGEITDLAEEFVDLVSAGDYSGAVEFFDASMSRAMPARKLGDAWKGLLSQVGSYIGQVSKRTDVIEGYDVVYVTTEFENAFIDIRVVFNSENRIAGLWFDPAEDAREGGYTLPSYVDADRFFETEVIVGAGEWELPGTLSIPNGSGPFPVVVLVHGSGPNDRDETIGPNKPFKDLAGGLASRGIAVLRYEKRTKEHAGKLSGQQETITTREETIDDALAAVSLLKNSEQIDASQIYVLGHSLGGTLAPRIGAEDKEIAGLIILAGAARPLEDVILEQVNYIVQVNDSITPEEETEMAKIEEQVVRVKSPELSVTTPAEDLPLGIPAAYWLDLRDYEPAQAAKTLSMPMLILQGERDYQVTMEDFAIWQGTLEKRQDVELKWYPDLNHLFVVGQGKSTPEEYQQPGNVSQIVIDDIVDWLDRN